MKYTLLTLTLIVAGIMPLSLSAAPERGLKYVETADGRQSSYSRELVQWTHSRFVFRKTLKRVAVGQESTMQVEVLGENEVLALAGVALITAGDRPRKAVAQSAHVLRRSGPSAHPELRRHKGHPPTAA